MKTFSVAVALAVVLTFICLQESSAVLITEVEELEEPNGDHYLIAAQEEVAEEPWKMPYNNRHKRAIKCRICCGCCTPGVCGLCCKF